MMVSDIIYLGERFEGETFLLFLSLCYAVEHHNIN